MAHSFSTHFHGILIFVGVMAALYLILSLLMAYLEVKASPREPMYYCHKHGFMRASYLLHLPGFDENDPTAGYCPLCFHERLSSAEKGR